jgi:hypothetical protein
MNPKRVAGAAQDSGTNVSVCPEGDPNPMRVSGASVPDSGSSEYREVVKTAWRGPGTRYRLRCFADAL